MINRIKISNFAIIDNLDLELKSGLNVLTGETGAGKTVIIEALNMIMGDRADTELVRTGFDEAIIEGTFSLDPSKDNLLIIEENEVIVSRNIYRNGKNKCFINGKLANLSKIKNFSEALVDLHGQHVHQSLFQVSTHLDFLDRYSGKELLEIREDFKSHYNNYKKLIETRKNISGNQQEKNHKLEFLKFKISEIEDADLHLGEEEELIEEKEKLANIESIKQACLEAYNNLSGVEGEDISARNLVGNAYDCLISISDKIGEIEGFQRKSDLLQSQLEELSIDIRKFLDDLESDPERLEEIENRLSEIRMLKNKYGKTINEIIEQKEKAQEELEELSSDEIDLGELESELTEEGGTIVELGKKLIEKRQKFALKLEKDVMEHLKDLKMEEARFKVEILQQVHPEGLNIENRKLRLFPWGFDKVEFLISTNAGEPIKPLNRVASGGELSRVMLALKIVLAKIDQTSTLIFDEVDSGIGGETASKVGKKLLKLSKSHQIICITHLPQIAIFADYHLKVDKIKKDNRTVVSVMEIESHSRVDEISRLMAGEGSSFVSRQTAEQLIKSGQKIKEKME